MNIIHIGIIPCRGENCIKSEVSKSAVNRVLNELRKYETFTASLPPLDTHNEVNMHPLRLFPIVTVDGSAMQCAKKVLKEYSINVTKSIIVIKIAGVDQALSQAASIKDSDGEQNIVVNIIIIKIIDKLNEIIDEGYF